MNEQAPKPNNSHIDFRFYLQRGTFVLDVDASFSAQGVTAIFGHSGCGKSTLLRCIAGLEQATHSYLSVKGELWEDTKAAQRLATYQRPIGYVFQEASLFSHLSVLQNLEYGQKRTTHPDKRLSLQHAIKLLGIETLLKRRPEHLSGGERQRVAIARALAVSPKLLLMDEPLAALDLRRKREILPFLEQLQHSLHIPILYVTHSPAEVKRFADHLAIMDEGKLITHGPLNDTQHHLLEDELFI